MLVINFEIHVIVICQLSFMDILVNYFLVADESSIANSSLYIHILLLLIKSILF